MLISFDSTKISKGCQEKLVCLVKGVVKIPSQFHFFLNKCAFLPFLWQPGFIKQFAVSGSFLPVKLSIVSNNLCYAEMIIVKNIFPAF